MAVWDVPTLHPQLQLQMPLDKPLAAAVSFHFHTYIKWFIRNCSSMATPLTALTSLKSPFVWSLVAEKASSELNHLFTSVPILIFPDPLLQFVVEVDSSHSGWISFALSDTDFFYICCGYSSSPEEEPWLLLIWSVNYTLNMENQRR